MIQYYVAHLYFNGDSFVAGTELGDDILPDFPGLFDPTLGKPEYIEQWHRTNHFGFKKWNNNEYCKMHRILEVERSFPNKVASKLNLPFTNSAKAAASMDRIARTTITDLIELKKSTPDKKVLAFIGTTSYNRSEIVVNKDFRDVSSTLRLISLARTEEIDMMLKFKVNNETDYHHIINFYRNIILIQDFCKSNDIPLFWISTIENVNVKKRCHVDEQSLIDKPDYYSLKEYANLSYTVDMAEIAEKYLVGQKYMSPGGHFGQPVHDLVTKELIEIINSLL